MVVEINLKNVGKVKQARRRQSLNKVMFKEEIDDDEKSDKRGKSNTPITDKLRFLIDSKTPLARSHSLKPLMVSKCQQTQTNI